MRRKLRLSFSFFIYLITIGGGIMSSFAKRLFDVAEDITPKPLALPIPPKGTEIKIIESVYLGRFKFGDRILAQYTT